VKRSCDWTAARTLGSLALLLGLFVPSVAQAVSEYKVKAAFLLNFGKYVEWPPSAIRGDSLDICVLGSDPFGDALDETVAGRTVGKRRVQARRVSSVAGADGCNILFVSRDEQSRVDAVLSGLADSPVLLVGEQERFARRGGMINFIEVDNKVRFEINEAAARRAGLKISSQLLKLATIIDGG